jgi:hypothetical protein
MFSLFWQTLQLPNPEGGSCSAHFMPDIPGSQIYTLN